MVYATATELTAFLGVAGPADADRLLTRASEVIDQAIRTAIYDVDASGNPTKASVLAVLSEATCAQVEYWLASDEEDDILGPVMGITVLGSMQVNYGTRADRVSPTYLAPRAHRILTNNGLRDGQPGSW